ncbi:YagK/YfjJ domain-containing protein [Pseudomonas mohnii]
MKPKTTFNRQYKGLTINTDKAKKYGAYTAILDAMHRQLMALQTHHSRIQIVLFELHADVTNNSGASLDNPVVSAFFKQIKEVLSSQQWGGDKLIAHCWVREVGKKGTPHYHCYIAFKQFLRRIGSVSSSGYTGLWDLLCSRWNALTDGYIRANKYYTVNRDNHPELNKAFEHLSYMAKLRDKDFGTGDTHKRYMSSRIKPKHSTQK